MREMLPIAGGGPRWRVEANNVVCAPLCARVPVFTLMPGGITVGSRLSSRGFCVGHAQGCRRACPVPPVNSHRMSATACAGRALAATFVLKAAPTKPQSLVAQDSTRPWEGWCAPTAARATRARQRRRRPIRHRAPLDSTLRLARRCVPTAARGSCAAPPRPLLTRPRVPPASTPSVGG